MKVMFKQSFKNMGYCWLMSDIVRNSFFFFEDKGLYHMMKMLEMFCSVFLYGGMPYIVVLSPRNMVNVMEVLGRVSKLWCTGNLLASFRCPFSSAAC